MLDYRPGDALTLFFSLLAGGLILASPFTPVQDLQHNVSVVNIEVPVRVFQGERFVDDLKLGDFEILEDGVPQTIEACHLVRGADVTRSEGPAAEKPRTARTIVLLFEMWSYFPEINDAVDVVFDRVLLPGDSLIVVTPLKTYSMADDALARLPGERLKEQLRGRLRQDIMAGGMEYREALRSLEAAMAARDESSLDTYRASLTRLEGLRRVETGKLVSFAKFLKGRAGPKHVFLLYQMERIPKLDAKTQNELMSLHQDDMNMLFNLLELFDFFKRDVNFDVRKIKEAFSDSSVAVQFLYLTKTPAADFEITAMRPSGLILVEQSEDIFRAFGDIAQTTGGITVSSSNPAAALNRAAAAAENYYLLYYTPRGAGSKPAFRTIEVRVTRPGVMVTHRAGYHAGGGEAGAAKPSGPEMRTIKK